MAKDRIGDGLFGSLMKKAWAVFADHALEVFTILGFDALALWRKGKDAEVANVIMAVLIYVLNSDDVLHSGATVKGLSMALQLVIPLPKSIPKEKRDEYFESFEDLLEEAGNKSTAFDKNKKPEENIRKAKEIVEATKAKLTGAVTDMSKSTTSVKVATSSTILDVLGGLTKPQSKAFGEIVERITGLSAPPTTPPTPTMTEEQRKAFLDKLVTATVSKSEILGIIHASTQKLQEELLRRIIEHTPSPSKVNEASRQALGAFARYMPSVQTLIDLEKDVTGFTNRIKRRRRILHDV
jgi:hypothetical protein